MLKIHPYLHCAKYFLIYIQQVKILCLKKNYLFYILAVVSPPVSLLPVPLPHSPSVPTLNPLLSFCLGNDRSPMYINKIIACKNLYCDSYILFKVPSQQ